jgi:hypothetical protein
MLIGLIVKARSTSETQELKRGHVYMYEGCSILSGLYFLSKDMSTRKMKHCMNSWWQDRTNCLAGCYDQLLCIVLQYGIRPYHYYCRAMLYHPIPNEEESETSSTSRLNAYSMGNQQYQ